MNKQALAFLTMFSLVLMLSVYYVTLPDDSTKTVMKDETGKTLNKETKQTKDRTTSKGETNTSKTDTVAKLQETIDQKKEVEINKNSEIVANKDSEEQAKKEALSTMDTLNAQKTLQKTIVDALQKEGYKTAVEINDTTCIVNVFACKKDKAVAKKILQKTSELTNQKYLVEVTFK